jgi:hypothetical protein
MKTFSLKFAKLMVLMLALSLQCALACADDGAPTPQSRLYSLFAPKAVAPAKTEDCPKDMTDSKFEKLLSQYPAIYHNKAQALEQWDLEDQITNAVFCSVGHGPSYLNYLSALEKVSSDDEQAYYNLAMRLQAHWQTQYALAISKVQQTRMQTVADDAQKLSLLVTGLSLLSKNASQITTVFSVARQLFPILLPAAAVGSEKLIDRHGLLEGRYPVSPASVMKLKTGGENENYDWYDIKKNLISATLSVAGAQVANKVIGGLVDAIAIGKVSFNPATILASYAAGYAIQDASQYAIDDYQYHHLVRDLLAARDAVTEAINNHDYMGMRTSAENFKTTAIYLSSFLDQKSLNIWVDYDNTLKSINGDSILKNGLAADLEFYTGKTSEYLTPDASRRKELSLEARQKRDERLETLQAQEDPVSLQDVQMEIAMNVMSTGTDNKSLLTGEQKVQAEIIAQGFDLYKRSLAPVVTSSDQEQSLYKNYLSKLTDDRDALLVQELMDGKINRNPSHILLQAAAFIHSLKQPVLNSISDDLLNIIFSGELFK